MRPALGELLGDAGARENHGPSEGRPCRSAVIGRRRSPFPSARYPCLRRLQPGERQIVLALFHAALVGVPVDVQRQKDIASIVGPDRSPDFDIDAIRLPDLSRSRSSSISSAIDSPSRRAKGALLDAVNLPERRTTHGVSSVPGRESRRGTILSRMRRTVGCRLFELWGEDPGRKQVL